MWTLLRTIAKAMLFDKTADGKASYGRIIALPFFLGSFGLSLASGIMAILHHASVADDAGMLTVTGFSLYTGSKYLTMRGEKMTMSSGSSAPDAGDKSA